MTVAQNFSIPVLISYIRSSFFLYKLFFDATSKSKIRFYKADQEFELFDFEVPINFI